MPVINGSSINADNDADHCQTLLERQTKADKNYDTLKDPVSNNGTLGDNGNVTTMTVLTRYI